MRQLTNGRKGKVVRFVEKFLRSWQWEKGAGKQIQIGGTYLPFFPTWTSGKMVKMKWLCSNQEINMKLESMY
jgi:hypothetical protein